jgi:hypothetical protein
MLVPASSEGSTQDHNRLSVDVVPTNRGPIPACHQDGSNCTSANATQPYIYVENESAHECRWDESPT